MDRMQQYRETLLTNIKQQLELWLDLPAPVPDADVRMFLHSLVGTAGTIGLTQLSELARHLLSEADLLKHELWSATELRTFLLELLPMIHGTESHQEMVLDLIKQDPKITSELASTEEKRPLVLVLDEDPSLLMYLKEGLEQRGWSVIATTLANKAIDYFHDMQPDCLVLDLLVPELGGVDIYETLQEKIRTHYIPTTIITKDCDTSTKIQVYRMGADDLMCKPLDLDELVARLDRQYRRKRWLERLVFVDELTGAYNRKFLLDSYHRVCSEARRTNEPFSVAMLDLDNFKKINDTYGHLAGDQVLSSFSKFIRERLRETDIFFRYGGEEFTLLLPRTDKEESRTLLLRMLTEFTTLRYDFAEDPNYTISFSAGVCEVNEYDKPLQQWVEAADASLYQAKRKGKNRIECSQSGNEEAVKKKLNIAIIDDDLVIRTMLTERIRESFAEKFDIEIRTFKDGQLFFADHWHAKREPYLLILDVMMPRMDGLEVLRRIRSLPDHALYSIIMLTGNKSEEDIVSALQLGADDYMTKPFHMRELEARMFRLVRQIV